MIQAFNRAALAILLGFALSPMAGCIGDSDSSSDDNGGQVDTPINWVAPDSGTSSGGTAGETPLLWIDPETGGGGGGGGTTPPPGGGVISTDTLTYAHGCPLRTQTTDASVTGPEADLYFELSQYRQTIGGGTIGIGGGTIGGLSVVAHSLELREVGRAHCKHMDHCFLTGAVFYNILNPEGDGPFELLDLNSIFYVAADAVITWGYNNAADAFSDMEATLWGTGVLEDPEWIRVGCGFWPGDNDNFWYLYFAL